MHFSTQKLSLVASLSLLYSVSSFAGKDEDFDLRLKTLETQMRALIEQNVQLKSQLIAAEKRLEENDGRLEKVTASNELAASNHFGGYGELHYNRLDNKKPGGTDKNEIDLHRFVLFFGHDFSPRTRFNSEVELEHTQVKDSGTSKGEASIEQAYIEHDIKESMSVKAGIFLVPVGILNEIHEPPTFYGVERNPVETNIIPTTWREGGVALTQRLGHGVTLDVAAHSGLSATAANSYAIRSGRKNVSEAPAKNTAYTGRIKWADIPGLELAATYHYQSDVTQSIDSTAGSARLLETHALWKSGMFGLKALWASWDLEGSGPKSIGANEQSGWYVEPSYKLSEQWGLFARHSRWDNLGGDAIDSRFRQTNVGVSFWLEPDVVLKADIQRQTVPTGKDQFNGFNLGVGYQF